MGRFLLNPFNPGTAANVLNWQNGLGIKRVNNEIGIAESHRITPQIQRQTGRRRCSSVYEGSSISLYPNYEGLVIEQKNLEGSKCIITERSMWSFGNIQLEVRTGEHFMWKH